LPGPLATFVARGRDKALDQYLLALAWASGGDHDVRKHSLVWARACGYPADSSGQSAVSRGWAFAQALNLVRVERVARLANVTMLKEDGSGNGYHGPGQKKADKETWLKLPFAYWTGRYYETLDLPAKAMLLIALDLPRRFPLPANRVPDWYGISASTAERGLHQLRSRGVLKRERVQKAAPLAPEGYTLVNYYTLQQPFGSGKSSASDSPR
jgi:hypothetical protein